MNNQGFSMRYFFLLVLFQVALLSSCSKSIYPNAPIEQYIEPKITQTESIISIPINFPIPQLEKQINLQTPDILYESDDISSGSGMDNLAVSVSKAGNIRISGSGDLLNISVPITTDLEGTFGGEALGVDLSQTFNTDFSLRINLTTKIAFNSKWQIITETKVKNYEWIESPSLNILGFELPVDFILDHIIESQRESLGELLDESIKKQVILKNEAQNAWNVIQQPLLISEEYKTHLLLKPVEIMMKPINYKNNHINTALGIKVFVETFVGADVPKNISKTNLSNLKITSDLDNQFSLNLKNIISRSFAIEELRKQFLGQVYEFGKRKIKIIDLDLYGSNENMVIKVGLEGSLKGYIYLEGKPVYDDQTQSIQIKDLNFGIDTKNLLVKTASWLFNGKINKLIEESMQVPLKTSLDDVKKDVEKQLTNYKLDKYATLNGKIDGLRLGDVFITKDAIIAVIQIAGSLNLKIEDF